MRRMVFTCFLCCYFGAGFAAPPGGEEVSAPEPARRQALVHLVRQDCGACHGLRLTGGLGPALTPDRLEKWPPEMLVAAIIDGRPGTPMPPWRQFLTDAEAVWIARQLQQGFPE